MRVCAPPICFLSNTIAAAVRSASGRACQIRVVIAAVACPAAEQSQIDYTLPLFISPLSPLQSQPLRLLCLSCSVNLCPWCECRRAE